jgi:MoxR-like ATPase
VNDSTNSAWDEWLQSIPDEQQLALYETLSAKLEGATSPKDEGRKLRVVKTPIEDLFVKSPPPYVDIFRLLPAYQGFNFSTNLLVKGPKGDGKSLSIATFAYETKSPLIVQECSEDTKKMDLMGTQNLLGDETIFTLGSIPAAIETANEYGRCILCFEELNALTNQVQKMLNAVTDFRKQCSLPFLGKTYQLKEGAYLWVVGLMNPSAYSGTYDLNEDLKSRFEEIDLPYPEAGAEKTILLKACQAVVGKKMLTSLETLVDGRSGPPLEYIDDTILTRLVKLAGETRQQATAYSLSTRDLVRIVNNFAVFGPEQALQFVLCKFEGEEDKNTMKLRISSIFSGMDKKLSNMWGGKKS